MPRPQDITTTVCVSSGIQSAMTSLMKGKTCFVIAHRLSTVEHADIILVIDGGEIKEQGRHSELIEKGGIYASMYNSQYE